MSEHKEHPIQAIGPAVRIVVVPGTPWHEAVGNKESSIAEATAQAKPWPGSSDCAEQDENGDCVAQADSEVCSECGHSRHQISPDVTRQYVDYALVEEVFLASGEPVSAGETCNCPCHGTA